MIRAREYLLTGLTYSLGILSRASLLERSSRALEGIAIEYFGPEIFALGCLSRIERILNFLVGFLARIEHIVSLRGCFCDATSKEGAEYGPFTGRPRFFRELSTVVSWASDIVRACATRINENTSLWLTRYKG
jgi:hypothetical protein